MSLLEAALQKKYAEQFRNEILGQQGQQYQPGMGMGMLENRPGTGLLGGAMTPQEAGFRALGIPGYQQTGLNLLNQFAPKSQGPTEYKTIELGAGGNMKQQFAYNPANPQQLIPMGRPYAFGATAGAKPTDTQLASSGYVDRMAGAENIFSNLTAAGYDPASISEKTKASVPFLGNIFASPQYQQMEQAQMDWVRAKLRKESGAVIGEKEMADEIKTYFPQPGDSQAVIEQKRMARIRAQNAMQKQAGGILSQQSAGNIVDFSELR